MSGASGQEQARRVEGFDGLRAWAAILVIAYHSSLITGTTRQGFLGPVLSELKAGVAIFFVISGFVLYLPHARSIRARTAPPDWRAFAWRRAVRLLPGYWVALTLLGVASLLGAGLIAPNVLGPEGWRFYGLTQIYQPATLLGGLGVAWSLAVEISFYAVLPALAAMMRGIVGRRPAGRGPRAELIVIAGIALWSLALRGLMSGSLVAPIPPNHGTLATSLPGMADWFALGMGLAVVRAEWEAGSSLLPGLQALARRPAACWTVAAIAYAAALPTQHGDLLLSLYGLWTHLALGLAAALFVLPAVLPGDRPARRGPVALLRSRQLTWLGMISYGMYLWHVPVRDLVDRGLGAPQGIAATGLVFGLTLVGGIALGAASWYIVEKPAQVWARRRLRPSVRVPVAATTALLDSSPS